jgi:hypothetical protein
LHHFWQNGQEGEDWGLAETTIEQIPNTWLAM